MMGSPFITALAVTIALYWIFNVELPSKAKNSFVFLSVYITEFTGVKIPVAVAKVCSTFSDDL